MDRNAVEVTFAGVTLRCGQDITDAAGTFRSGVHVGRVKNASFSIMSMPDGTWNVSVTDPHGDVLESIYGLVSPDDHAEAMFVRYAEWA